MYLEHPQVFSRTQILQAYKKASPASYYFWKFWSERKAFGVFITLIALLLGAIVYFHIYPLPANSLKLLVIHVVWVLGCIIGTLIYAAPALEAERPEELVAILSVPYIIKIYKRDQEVVIKQRDHKVEPSLVGDVNHELLEYTMTKPMFDRFNKALKKELLKASLEKINSATVTDSFV